MRAQSTSHIDAGTSITEIEYETDSDSGKFRCFNRTRWTRQCCIASERQVGCGIACSVAQGYPVALFIHWITLAKRMREVWPAVLVGESTCTCTYISQLLMYSLDTCTCTGIRYSIYTVLTDFQVSERLHWGPEFSHNYLIDYTIGFIIHYTIITS